MINSNDRKIGLIAGNGTFPMLFAQEARRQGDAVIAVALKEEADPALEKQVDAITWLSLGQLGRTIDYFKDQGVQRAVMAGQVKHTQLFRDIIPDLRAAKLLIQAADKKADTLLSAVIREFEQDGIEFLPSTTYLDHLLCAAGPLTRRAPTAREQSDIAFGLPLAQAIAGLDAGQTVIVKEKTVVAVEAMEGTDSCILRAGRVAGPGTVIVKVARPKQDVRFDMPVIGPGTLSAMQEAGATVLAVQARHTLILDKSRVVEAANANGLCLTGV